MEVALPIEVKCRQFVQVLVGSVISSPNRADAVDASGLHGTEETPPQKSKVTDNTPLKDQVVISVPPIIRISLFEKVQKTMHENQTRQ